MKNILISAICTIIMLVGASCKENPQVVAEKKLLKAVSEVTLPRKVDNTTTLTAISLCNHILSSRIEIPAERLAKINPDSLTQVQVEQLATNLTSHKVRELALKAGVTLRYVYASGTDSVVIVITPDAMTRSFFVSK